MFGRYLAVAGVFVAGLAVACSAHRSEGGSPEGGGASGAGAGESSQGGADNGGHASAGGDPQGGDDGLSGIGGGGASACPTLQVPSAPFLIEPLADPGNVVCSDLDECSIGPWLMTFRTVGDSDLEGALVSAQQALWPRDAVREAASFRLHADDGVYRLSPTKKATLATYTYMNGFGPESVPGVCLAAPGAVFGPSESNEGSAFEFVDDNGDCVADAVTLSGNVVGLGQRGGDYDDDCGDEGFPLATQGHVVTTAINPSADGDVLEPKLILEGGFLQQGSAQVRGPDRKWLAAEPLTLSGFIYGFAANVVLEPGAPLAWRIDGLDLLNRKLVGDVSLGQSEVWLKVSDPTFESLDSGEAWGTGDAKVEEHCNPSAGLEPNEALPPIAGARSLVIDLNGYRERFRFARTPGQTRLSFVAFGTAGVELATVGSVDGMPLRQTPSVTDADCEKYAAFCARVPTGTLKRYSVALPTGTADVLVRLANEDRSDWSSGGGTDLCVDDLRLE